MVNIILDTNLLLLYLIGSYDIDLIGANNLTTNYTKNDFKLLKAKLEIQNPIYITPQILAELSNQSTFFKEPALSEYFGLIIQKLSNFNEGYIKLKDILKNVDLLPKIGFTDVSIFELAKNENFVVLTDDFELYGRLNSSGYNSLNFAQLRGDVWFN